MTPQELSDRLWQFAARIGKLVDALPNTRVGRHVAGQVVRSGIILAELLPSKRVQELIDECEQLCRILGKSVVTTKR